MALLVPTTRLKTKIVDDRHIGRKPIARVGTVIEVPDTVNTVTKRVSANGQLFDILVSSPNIPTDANFSLTIKDLDGQTLHANASINDNSIVKQELIDATPVKVFLDGAVDLVLAWTTALLGDTMEFDIVLKVGDPIGILYT